MKPHHIVIVISLAFSVICNAQLTAAPAAPVNLGIILGNGTASLDWDDNTESDLSRYAVYRRTTSSGFVLLGTTTSSDSTETGLTNNEDYTYLVTAVDISANESGGSNEVTGTPTVPTATPVSKSYHQVGATEVLGYDDAADTSGSHFEDYVGFPNLSGLATDYSADTDGDDQLDIMEYKLSSDFTNSGSQSIIEVTSTPGSAPTFSYHARISSPTAYARALWSTDLGTWSGADMSELSRTTQPDGVTELITLRLDDPSLTTATRTFVRVGINTDDYNASFVVPPTARHSTAVSMIARKAAYDPRSVQYSFEATSAGGNDSGWQRDPMYVDSGTRDGDSALTAGTTYSYRVKVRELNPATGAVLPSTESEYSPTVSVTTPAAVGRPNVVVIMCDDLGWEAFDLYGSSSHNTPRITEMANEGIRLTNFHSQPLCTPSRVAIMSGRSNHRNYTAFSANLQNTSFGNFFQNAGYKTAIAGKWQLDGNSLNGISRRDPRIPHWQGFDEYLLWHYATTINNVSTGERYWNPDLLMTIPGTHTNRLDSTIPAPVRLTTNHQWDASAPGTTIDGTDFGPDMVNTFINDFITKAADAGDSFFVYCPMILPHNPWPNPPTIDDSDPKGTQSATGDSKHALTEYMDHLVGKTLDLIRNHPDPNVSENTLVIFTGDNGTNRSFTSTFRGAPFPGRKRETRDAGHHVPFVAWWGGAGGKIPTGQISHDMVVIYDIMATVCDAAGVPVWRPNSVTGGAQVEYIHDGRSFLSSFQGRNRQPRRHIYQLWEFNGNAGTAAWVYNAHYKLYRDGPTDGADSVVDNMDRSGRFFDTINTPLERVPNGSNTIDDSLPTPTPGSRLEALKAEFQMKLDLMDQDAAYDAW